MPGSDAISENTTSCEGQAYGQVQIAHSLSSVAHRNSQERASIVMEVSAAIAERWLKNTPLLSLRFQALLYGPALRTHLLEIREDELSLYMPLSVDFVNPATTAYVLNSSGPVKLAFSCAGDKVGFVSLPVEALKSRICSVLRAVGAGQTRRLEQLEAAAIAEAIERGRESRMWDLLAVERLAPEV